MDLPDNFSIHPFILALTPLGFIDYNDLILGPVFHNCFMFSFKSNEGALLNSDWVFFGGSAEGTTKPYRGIWAALLGEERPRDMMLLLAIFVLLLHVWLVMWVKQRPEEKVTEAVPLVMEVSMISLASPKLAVAPPKPAPPPPPPPEKKPAPPKKVQPPKPVVKKPPPVVQKAPDFAPAEPVEPPPPPVSTAAPTNAASSSSTTSSQSTSTSASASTSTQETFTEANYRANYAHNPKPEYPTIAKSRGWQGKVLLRVKVSAQGLSEAVAVEQSSGHEILDEAAMEAVKQWRFIPAKRGDTPVASSVIVPIVFSLRN